MSDTDLRSAIAKAYTDLKRQGVTPSQRTIREAIGFGSFQTIGPILKEIREEDSKDPFTLAEFDMPDSLKHEWIRLIQKTLECSRNPSTSVK